jgi:hypothetical protein
MCGRYRLSHAERFAQLNGLEFADGMPADEFSEVRLGGRPFPAPFNVAPTQQMPWCSTKMRGNSDSPGGERHCPEFPEGNPQHSPTSTPSAWRPLARLNLTNYMVLASQL